MMIPITRKEKYINEIVGGGDTAPKTPQTREEFFFAEILGEVIAPSPVTRVEKYLSAIARQYSGDLPTPITRIEYFLARAAGMEIETPIPITREEMLWDTYISIKTIEGIPPLTFKAKKAGTLKNYRIYGQTVDGESVGDRTGNLFSTDWMQGGIDFETGNYVSAPHVICTENFIKVSPNTTYSISRTIYTSYIQIRGYDANKQYIGGGARVTSKDNPLVDGEPFGVFTVTNNNVAYIKLNDMSNDLSTEYMMVEGSYTAETMPSYEPYGYKVPVTVSNGTDTQTIPIYLPEQIRKVGDEAEYISYADQKLHRVGADDIDVTLPEMPMLPGTNTLSVGTEVQPSDVEIKGEIQEVTL